MTVPQGAEGIIGKHYRQEDHFVVGREKIREFAASIKDENPIHYDEAVAAEAGYAGLLAPLTFLAIAGRRVQLEIFTKFSIPINIARVMHRDQKFHFHRPIVAGDELYFDTYLDSVISPTARCWPKSAAKSQTAKANRWSPASSPCWAKRRSMMPTPRPPWPQLHRSEPSR